MILIVSSMDDYHARVVARILEDRGVSVMIADVAELGCGAEIVFCPDDVAGSVWRRTDGVELRLGEIDAVWLRRYHAPVPPLEVMDATERDFIQSQWKELVFGVFEILGVPFINDLRANMFATKPLQLALAHRLGLNLPATLVTNSADAARRFVDDHRGEVIHKTLRSSRAMLDTKRWDAHDESVLGELTLAPTIFQARVDGSRELRITVVGRQVFAAEHHTELVDGRLDTAAPYHPHVLPDEVKTKLLALVDQLGLSYASIDMRCYADGAYAFLEVTPMGQYLWIEIHTGLPISEAVADLLIATAATGRARKAPPAHLESRLA